MTESNDDMWIEEPGDLSFGPHDALDPSRDAERAKKALASARHITVRGASNNALRKSARVVGFLQEQGLSVQLTDQTKTLPDSKEVDTLVVFCAPDEVPSITEELSRSAAPTVWFQEGLMCPESARLLERSGKAVIMDRCIMRDYQRFVLGEDVGSWFPI